MGVAIPFDYAAWVALYPEFTNVTQPQAQGFFALATESWSNDGSGPIDNAQQQTSLLYLLTAHIAYLLAPVSAGGSGSGVVGRITNASEGSVSVAVNGGGSGNSWWYLQSKYGALFWMLTRQYRQFRYRPGYGRNFSPYRGPSAVYRRWP